MSSHAEHRRTLRKITYTLERQEAEHFGKYWMSIHKYAVKFDKTEDC